MKRPYLIQRFEPPLGTIKFPAPAACINYYLNTPEANQANKSITSHQWLTNAARCDYMGSSEFEWGALPKSLREMAELGKAGQLITETMELIGVSYRRWRDEVPLNTPKEMLAEQIVEAWLICPAENVAEIKKYISIFSVKEPDFRTKEFVGMQRGIFGEIYQNRQTGEPELRRDYSGWYDLDNHWFLTTNQDQFKAIKILLGIK